MKNILLACFGILFFISSVHAQVWQWSVPVDSIISGETNDHPRAFLWIPENCKQVKAVVFTQHNMIEEGILEHPVFRKTMTELGIAEIWVTPAITLTFDFNKDAGKDFNRMMQLLADASGYSELTHVPVIPMGHSALASFPWNFAAWDPSRTLALVSVHGDAPLTNLTGSGKPNPDWGDRNIDGVPSLFIMGEYEWWEDRIRPAFDFINKNPASAISLLCDAGHGHFDYSDDMIGYVCMFIKKAAEKRLPKNTSIDKTAVLHKIDPEKGWLMDRWYKDSLPSAKAAPYADYKGDRQVASWVFDRQMAVATERFYAMARKKKEQIIGFRQNGQVLQPVKTHAIYQLKFVPLENGISFILSAFFTDSSKMKPVAEFAQTALLIDRICGPVKKINDTTFQIHFNRLGFNNTKRSNDIWLLAHNSGDEKYKSAVQQLDMRFPLENKEGLPQEIGFNPISNVKASASSVPLSATSTTGLPIYYYVKEGPAFVSGSQLIFTSIPPRAKYPIKVTVVGWQYGIAGKYQSAKPVEHSFYIVK